MQCLSSAPHCSTVLSNGHRGERFIGNVFTQFVVGFYCSLSVTKMTGMRLITPTELYNLINQETKYPCLSDPVFMLLVGEPDLLTLHINRVGVIFSVGGELTYHTFLRYLQCVSMLSAILPPPSAVTTADGGGKMAE